MNIKDCLFIVYMTEQLPDQDLQYYEHLITSFVNSTIPINMREEIEETNAIDERYPFPQTDSTNPTNQQVQQAYIDNNGNPIYLQMTYDVNIPNLDPYIGTMTELINMNTQSTPLFNNILNLINLLSVPQNMEDVRTPMTADAISNIPEKTFKEITEINKNDTCAICQEKYTEDTIVKILPCNHYFHKDCIGTWFGIYHHICPVCRSDSGEHTTQT